MSQNLIIICILGILLWYYFMKTKEFEYRNIQLYNEIQNRTNYVRKLKSKNKYLQTYKTDVSNTFKILNNELDSINEIIKPTLPNLENPSTPEIPPQINLLNFLIENRQQQQITPSAPSTSSAPLPPLQENLFTSFLNNFLTQNILPENPEEQEQEQLQQLQQLQQENTELPLQLPLPLQQQENTELPLPLPLQQQENTEEQYVEQTGSIHFSVDYIPLRGNYSRFLMDPIPEVTEESEN